MLLLLWKVHRLKTVFCATCSVLISGTVGSSIKTYIFDQILQQQMLSIELEVKSLKRK